MSVDQQEYICVSMYLFQGTVVKPPNKSSCNWKNFATESIVKINYSIGKEILILEKDESHFFRWNERIYAERNTNPIAFDMFDYNADRIKTSRNKIREKIRI